MAKKVLITGGNKGIGLAAARQFRDAGYEVTVIGRDFRDFHEDGIQAVTFDLNEIETLPLLVDQIGEINILVNNAGIDRKRPYND